MVVADSVVDPSQHLRLIHRVIRQMNLYGDLAEEAYSESLVTIVEASKTYDAEKGPLASWLANNIRWSIRSWIARQNRFSAQYLYADVEDTRFDFSSVEVDELVAKMKHILTDTEFKVLVLTAVGYSGKEIEQKLSMSAVQITRTKQKARMKMEKYR